MSESFHWDLPGLDLPRFISLARVHYLRYGGQLDSGPVTDLLNDSRLRGQSSGSENGDIKYLRLKIKFLDRLAEIMSRKKGIEWVTCAAMQEQERHVDVWLSRNDGFVEYDQKFVTEFVALMEHLGKNYQIDSTKEKLWGLLLRFYSPRLRFYVGKIQQLLVSRMPIGIDAKLVQSFKNIPKSGALSLDHLSRLVIDAYHARQGIDGEMQSTDDFWTYIGFLARPRDAFQVFKQIGRTSSHSSSLFPFRCLKFHLIPAVEDHRTPLNRCWGFKEATQNLPLSPTVIDSMYSNNNSSSVMSTRFAQLQSDCLYVHAEVQLVLALLSMGKVPEHDLFFQYIACSKLCCFMCRIFLGSLGLNYRGSHNKIYHRWTIPVTQCLSPFITEKISMAILDLQRKMEHLLEVKRPAEPFLALSDIGSPWQYEKSTLASSVQDLHQSPPNVIGPLTPSIMCYERGSDLATIRGSDHGAIVEVLIDGSGFQQDAPKSTSSHLTSSIKTVTDGKPDLTSSSRSLTGYPSDLQGEISEISDFSSESLESTLIPPLHYCATFEPPIWALEIQREVHAVRAQLDDLEHKFQLLAALEKIDR